MIPVGGLGFIESQVACLVAFLELRAPSWRGFQILFLDVVLQKGGRWPFVYSLQFLLVCTHLLPFMAVYGRSGVRRLKRLKKSNSRVRGVV